MDQNNAARHANDDTEPLSLWGFLLLEEASRRLAQRVSDGPGQLLANAIFELAACIQLMDGRPELAKEGLAALEEELRAGLRATQQLVFDLNPLLLTELGLAATVRNYAARFQKESGLLLHLDLEAPVDQLPRTLELMVFRILQEALHNVQQHAQATEVWVSLRPSGDTLELVVEDNGIGLNLDDIETGRRATLGLVSMHDRASIVGGTLVIGNRVAGGARVHLAAPTTRRS